MEDLKHKLEKIITEKLGHADISPEIAIQAIIEFYNQHKIQPENDDSESDMLLFQYGSYDWTGNGPEFEFNVTRQIEDPDDDEFFQISLTLKYKSQETNNIESFNLWSVDCDSIEDWANEIMDTEGFKIAATLKPLEYKIELSKT
jgi:hypothetical protein